MNAISIHRFPSLVLKLHFFFLVITLVGSALEVRQRIFPFFYLRQKMLDLMIIRPERTRTKFVVSLQQPRHYIRVNV